MSGHSKRLVFFLIFGFSLFANPPDTLWTRTFGDVDDDFGFSVLQTSEGGYIIAGSSVVDHGVSKSSDVYLVRVDATGNRIWHRSYGGTLNDQGYSVDVIQDGGYIIAGAKANDIFLCRVDTGGAIIWEKTYGGPNSDEARAVLVVEDTNYIVAGSIENKTCLMKLNSVGDTVWIGTYEELAFNKGYSVTQTSEGGYIIAGVMVPPGTGGDTTDVLLLKTNSKGQKTWHRCFGGSGYDRGFSVAQTSDLGYIITGSSNSFGLNSRNDVYLIKTDSLGNEIWSSTFGGTAEDRGYSVDQTSEGGYIIAGYSGSIGSDSFADVYLIKTDASGETLWTALYGGSTDDGGCSIEQTSDGGYIIAGYTASFGPGDYDMYLIRIGPDLKIIENKESTCTRASVVMSNPVKGQAIFKINLPERTPVELSIYDALGRLVARPLASEGLVGTHDVAWSQGSGVGVYFYCLSTTWSSVSGKFVIIR